MTSRQHYTSSLPGPLGWLDTTLSKVEALVLSASVLLMALNTCSNVVARFVFGEGLFVSGEINRILIILITFAGIGYAARHGRHIRMSAFYDLLPTTSRKVAMILIAVMTAAIMFFLSYLSVHYVVTTFERGRILPALNIPIWWIYIWVPVGFAITGIQYLLTASRNMQSKQDVFLSSCVTDSYDNDTPQP
ncbi:C4-dicarboxylate ABC transporter permease [Bacterioplanes sanyensis]|uniref:TRAP transporter small permease protein n=1 Tax=Bacterioplanes sanyensis TaxID=1249553 RepID=A0A222FIC4_9GAMM|nr:TRAP transporter small permease [Bacterioplanes sanyensis]ASP38795.1 C4-dicarboxylate ABC transporter permease [Bacterioplanes sanyensis]